MMGRRDAMRERPTPHHTHKHEQRHVSSTPVTRLPLDESKMPSATESDEQEGKEPSGESRAGDAWDMVGWDFAVRIRQSFLRVYIPNALCGILLRERGYELFITPETCDAFFFCPLLLHFSLNLIVLFDKIPSLPTNNQAPLGRLRRWRRTTRKRFKSCSRATR